MRTLHWSAWPSGNAWSIQAPGVCPASGAPVVASVRRRRISANMPSVSTPSLPSGRASNSMATPSRTRRWATPAGASAAGTGTASRPVHSSRVEAFCRAFIWRPSLQEPHPGERAMPVPLTKGLGIQQVVNRGKVGAGVFPTYFPSFGGRWGATCAGGLTTFRVYFSDSSDFQHAAFGSPFLPFGEKGGSFKCPANPPPASPTPSPAPAAANPPSPLAPPMCCSTGCPPPAKAIPAPAAPSSAARSFPMS
ncbi:hypothetical protein D3C78_1218610 [compost metagenome]